MRTLRAEPIEENAWMPFGALIAPKNTPRIANHGRAEAWDELAELVNARPGIARPTVSLFRCAPERSASLEVRWLERHPRSTQMFVPMRAGRYLLIVAYGADAPDPASLRAFVVEGSRAITYRPGTWHHPMIALDEAIDFVNFIYADGTEADCEEVAFDPPCARVVIDEARG